MLVKQFFWHLPPAIHRANFNDGDEMPAISVLEIP